jgi:Asp-tRNA(Asn)/Glu-tRNA(Gln) amidotransferase C subunit
VNTDELLPTYQVTNLTNVSRADEIKAYSYKAADLLLNVPAIKDQHIQVKRMI